LPLLFGPKKPKIAIRGGNEPVLPSKLENLFHPMRDLFGCFNPAGSNRGETNDQCRSLK
jgi:hypothetical protein